MLKRVQKKNRISCDEHGYSETRTFYQLDENAGQVYALSICGSFEFLNFVALCA